MSASLGRAPTTARRHGAEFLADLLDFEGAVRLAHVLDAARPSVPPAPRVAADALARARLRLATLERDARLPLREARTAGPLVSAERLERALDAAGAPHARQRKALEAAGHELFAPVESAALRRIQSVRNFVAEVRQEVASVIASRGAAGARLEQLDAALASATAARRDALFARAVTAAGDAFAAALVAAVTALPRPCTAPMPVAEWAGEGGVVHAHVARCEALVVAVYLHERARLDTLARATLGEGLA